MLRRGAAREQLSRAWRAWTGWSCSATSSSCATAPAREALAVARPVLADIAAALAPGTPVIIVPGNHDHALIDPWLVGRGRRGAPEPLGLAEAVSPRKASPLAAAIERAMAPASVELSYPGVWLRDDVWATHGHYLDVHATLPTFERLAAGVMSRLVGPVPQPRATPDDYERVLAPVYAWIDAAAERAAPGRAAAGSGSAVQAYRLLSGGGRRPMAARAVAGLFPLAILGINRLGLGPVSADLRGPELRRSALRGMGEAVMRLGVPARHVIFGHSHRAGPLPGDDVAEWHVPGGPQLVQRRLLDVRDALPRRSRPARQPLLAGRAHRGRRRGPPRLERLLETVPAADLRGAD